MLPIRGWGGEGYNRGMDEEESVGPEQATPLTKNDGVVSKLDEFKTDLMDETAQRHPELWAELKAMQRELTYIR